MMKLSLSPAAWSVLAVAGVAATTYQAIFLFAPQPTTISRFGFALSGFIAIASLRRSVGIHVPAWSNVGRFLLSTACLLLVAAILLPVFAKKGARSNRHTPYSHLRMIALGCMHYAQDYDDHLPPPGTPVSTRPALDPYLKSPALWKYANQGVFVINPTVLGKSISNFPTLSGKNSTTVLAYSRWQETLPNGSRYRFVAFLDAKVKWIPEPDFQTLLRQTEAQAVGSETHAKGKP
ncbi:MAG: hypothetical protein H7145_23040 [Akkermansiaceae bacterium]|nr:hypothetical protein [Armatimonadota bacterium]